MDDREPQQEQQNAKRNSRTARNVAAAAGGLAAGGFAERDTLESVVRSDEDPIAGDDSFDVFEELDSTYRPGDTSDHSTPELPGLVFAGPQEAAPTGPEPVDVSRVEIATPSTGIDPLDEMASISDDLPEIDGDESPGLDAEDDLDSETVF